MIVFGTAGIPLSCNGNILDAIEWNAQHGLKALEVEFVRGVWGKQKLFEKAKERSDKLKVILSVHAPYYINLLSNDEEKIKASYKRIISSAKRAQWMNAKLVVVHTGYYGKLDKKQAFEIAVERYGILIDKMREQDIKVMLSPEVLGRKSQFACLEQIIDLTNEIGKKYMHPTIDFAHIAAMQKYDLTKQQAFDEIFEMLIKKLKTNEFHIHFSGVEFGEKGEKKHLVFEQAKTPNYKLFIKALKKNNIKGEVICESPAMEFDTLKLLEEYEK